MMVIAGVVLVVPLFQAVQVPYRLYAWNHSDCNGAKFPYSYGYTHLLARILPGSPDTGGNGS